MDTATPAPRPLATLRTGARTALATTGLGLLLAPPAAAAPEPAEAGTDVRAYLQQVADDQQLPGLAVAVVDGDSVGTHMIAEDGDGAAMSESTPFLLGSVSKSVTATAVLDLAAADELTLDDRLGDLLPEHGIADERADDITVQQLLTHTAGLTTADGLAHADRFDTASGALQRQATGLDDVTLARDPGAGYEYSDLGYLLLGAIVEEQAGAPFAEVVTDRVLAPAGVEQVVADEASAEALPPGHRQVLGRPVAFDTRYDTSGAPYGYLGTDLDGAAAWARAQLGGGGIDEATLAELHTARVQTGSGDAYGYGWRVGEQDGHSLVEHTGATPGYFSHVRVQPERDRAVVVLANSYSEARAGALYDVAGDVQRILDGEQPQRSGADPVLAGAPFAVLGLSVVGVLAALAALRRGTPTRVLVLVAGVLLTALALVAPSLLGYTSAQLRLWAPDLGWGLWAVVATWSVAGLTAAVAMVRRRGRGRDAAG